MIRVQGDIRKATPDDAVGLTDCTAAAYAGFDIPDLPDVTIGIADDIAAHTVLVCVHQGRIIGGLILSVDGSAAHLRNVAVHPDHNGRGIGTALINAAIATLDPRQVKSVDLATHRAMPGNVMLYSRLGWVETGRAGNKILMTRAL